MQSSRTKRNTYSGMTLMSVMVAIALAGIVAVTVARLLGTQSRTLSVIKLREQREHLLKHYKNIVVAGWDQTRSSCSGTICGRSGSCHYTYRQQRGIVSG